MSAHVFAVPPSPEDPASLPPEELDALLALELDELLDDGVAHAGRVHAWKHAA